MPPPLPCRVQPIPVLTQYIQGKITDRRLAVSDRDADFLEYVTAHRGRMLRTARFAGSCHYKK